MVELLIFYIQSLMFLVFLGIRILDGKLFFLNSIDRWHFHICEGFGQDAVKFQFF